MVRQMLNQLLVPFANMKYSSS